ncbi:NERD domain-containing protein [Patulibacter sp.]|uniref:NERD domain-containing protein n=1 Tax=Patulibacter sp. TaxID=1912859 RepID=UPI002726F80F|nr:NERD domain-containing protein [Patulibacter sp.]MDO9406764.1 NERD domain-containing protein [Patulibacter sp.]
MARSQSSVRSRRRDVEAELIGLHVGGTEDRSWWEPCWERGLDDGVPTDRLFDALRAFRPEVRVLHDLRVAGAPAPIDHVLVGPGGVVVADSEACQGRVRTDGVHLRVRGRDRSPMIDVALWQAEVIRSTLRQRGIRDVPVHGVLHWQHLEGLGDRAICLRGVPLLSAGAAMGLAGTGIDLSPLSVERITAALAPASAPH